MKCIYYHDLNFYLLNVYTWKKIPITKSSSTHMIRIETDTQLMQWVSVAEIHQHVMCYINLIPQLHQPHCDERMEALLQSCVPAAVPSSGTVKQPLLYRVWFQSITWSPRKWHTLNLGVSVCMLWQHQVNPVFCFISIKIAIPLCQNTMFDLSTQFNRIIRKNDKISEVYVLC